MMTEADYIRASDLARFRAARNILTDVVPLNMPFPGDRDLLTIAFNALGSLIDRYYEMISHRLLPEDTL